MGPAAQATERSEAQGSAVGSTGLARAIARIEGRYGTHALARGGASERHRDELALPTGTSLDLVTGGGLAAGEPLAFVGPASVGKLSLAFRVVATAQRTGGMVAWIDPSASLDPLAAVRSGVDLERLVVVRARSAGAAALAASASLRSEGFRLVVVDTGPAFAGIGSDELAPVLPSVRGSPAALLVVSEDRRGGYAPSNPRLVLPTCTFERVSWERRFERTVGWTFEVGGPRGHSPLDKRALFAVPALGAAATDLGRRAGLAEAAAS